MYPVFSILCLLFPISLSATLWTIMIVFVLGFCLGLGYFGGLWLTLKKLPQVNHPYRLVIGSFVLRLIISLFCFYGLIYLFGNLDIGIILLIAVLGFIFARLVLTQQIASEVESQQK